jgi:hypothetical protein
VIQPPSSLRDRILEAAKKEEAPARDRVRMQRRLAVAIGIAVSTAIFAAVGAMGPLPRSFLLACAAGWTAVSAVVMTAGLARRKAMLGMTTRALVFAAAGLAPLVFAWIAMLVMAMKPPCVAPEPKEHLVCFSLGLVFAAAPFAAVMWVRRGTDPVHPGATGAALGASAGALGGMLIHLHCPYADPMHALVGHVLPIALLGAIGALVGRRLLAVR